MRLPLLRSTLPSSSIVYKMADFPRYSRIEELFHEALQSKTGWGRNEVEELLRRVLIRTSDEEMAFLMKELSNYRTNETVQ